MDAEDELVRRSRSGDRLAFARLVEEHQTAARRVATAIVGWGGDADDVVQEAFMKAFTRLGQFDEGRAFRPWFLTIVTNEARNRHRSSGRRAAVALRVAAHADRQGADPPDSAGDPVRAAEAAEVRRRLATAVATLSERDREIIALRFFVELSEAESAEVLGCPVGTVKSRLSRALAHLRTAMAEEVAT
jgi:RNA polymerase sigma-70 factor (ECF subfamily)